MEFTIYNITPVPKPRQTQKAKWKKTPGDIRYYAFKDQIRAAGLTLPDSGYHVIFVLPMPESWTYKKRAALINQPHTQVPDLDNITKALYDSLFKRDEHIWDGRMSKLWGETGKIIVITGLGADYISKFLKEQNWNK